MPTTTLGQGALGRCDLVISQGADVTFAFRYLTTDGMTKTPVDLTGWVAKAQIRTSISAAEAWITLDGVVDADGNITLNILHSETEGELWDARDDGVWDLELTSCDRCDHLAG